MNVSTETYDSMWLRGYDKLTSNEGKRVLWLKSIGNEFSLENLRYTNLHTKNPLVDTFQQNIFVKNASRIFPECLSLYVPITEIFKENNIN